MRFFPFLLGLAILATTSALPVHTAHAEVTLRERTAARRDLERAKIELRHYWLVEYPRQRRDISAAIDLTRTQIRNLKEQLRSYGPFDRFSTGSPFLLTMQRVKFCIQEAELRLADLQTERNALVRFHSDEYRAYALAVQDARLHVAEIEAAHEAAAPGTPITVAPLEPQIAR